MVRHTTACILTKCGSLGGEREGGEKEEEGKRGGWRGREEGRWERITRPCNCTTQAHTLAMLQCGKIETIRPVLQVKNGLTPKLK